MAQNAYANKLIQTKKAAYTDGLLYGMGLGFNIVAIALNHEFGFGESRIKRLEQKVQALVDEIIDVNDPIVTEAHIEMALKQIRKEEWGK